MYDVFQTATPASASAVPAIQAQRSHPTQPAVASDQSLPGHTDTYNPTESVAPEYTRQDFLRTVRGGGPGGDGPEVGDRPHYTDDPTLDHNDRVCDPNIHNQRLVGADGRWDGARILRNVGQQDTLGQPNNQGSRCGSASLLAGAVMGGPEATARFTERLSTHITDAGQQRELNDIRNRILNNTATNGDLSRVQEITYNRYNTDGQPGLEYREQNALHQDLARTSQFDPIGGDCNEHGMRQTDVQGVTAEEPGRTRERIDGLRNGQSFTLFVDTDTPNNGPNHFVQVGRDQNGRNYAYDPLARDNQPHIIYQDENRAAFGHYVNGSSGETHPDIPGRFNWVRGATVQY